MLASFFQQTGSCCILDKNNLSSWIEIDKNAFECNIISYKQALNQARLIAVIKSNAYGHGIAQIASICEHNVNIDMMAVVCLQEALFLRSMNIKKDILILSILNGCFETAISQNIDLVAHDMDVILKLNNVGKKLNKKANIHIKVDTGLSRLGADAKTTLQHIKQIYELPFINIRGIFTHFADAESEDQTFTDYQIEQFSYLIRRIEDMNIDIPFKHASCSASTTTNLNSHFSAVRIGIGIYGLWPSDDNKKITKQIFPKFCLKPVLTWKTRAIQIKDISAGSFIGYDRTYKVEKDSRIAVLPVGYWDGYDRQLSNNGKVLINKQLASIIGRISMNLCMVDITGLNVSLDDDVILLGNSPEITADDLAKRCKTINYEIVTRINPLIPRFIV